ncbi:hypothetical protein EYF80_013292 [Liparis tanakae]|uniref:Uncharacterized protein n=1 Tax=Liparis tanakae TaxID=230148 RepID=A0A4Z2IF02_9TELE|nr:hypothetical protein EYF80_013292 [Liparis tanakae]
MEFWSENKGNGKEHPARRSKTRLTRNKIAKANCVIFTAPPPLPRGSLAFLRPPANCHVTVKRLQKCQQSH